MTDVKEIKQAFEDFAEEWDGWTEVVFCLDDPEPLGDLGTIVRVESAGGEGEGDSAWAVFKFTAKDGSVRHFQKDGYYASHYGYDWDGAFFEVRQVEKLVKVWEQVK